MRLSIVGNVEKFVTIQPSQVRLRGFTGEQLKKKVTIIPVEKYPFKIKKVRVQNGKDIRFELQEEKNEKGRQYALIVENERLSKGRYFDVLTLETDSQIQPAISIRVYGQIMDPPQKSKKESH